MRGIYYDVDTLLMVQVQPIPLQIPYSTSLNFGTSLKGKALVLYKFNPDKLFIAQEEGSMLFKSIYMKKKGGRLRRFLIIVDGTSRRVVAVSAHR